VLVLGRSGEEKERVGCWAAQRKRESRWRAGPAGEYGPIGFWKILKDLSISYFDSNSNLIRISNEFYTNLKLKHSIESK
jgi:hypothetical protein